MELETIIKAPIQKVWKAISDKEEMTHWYFSLDTFIPEPRFESRFKGGKDPNHPFIIIEVIPNGKLSYSWTYEGYTFVSFNLSEEGEHTRLKFLHEGLETFSDTIPDLAKENFEINQLAEL